MAPPSILPQHRLRFEPTLAEDCDIVLASDPAGVDVAGTAFRLRVEAIAQDYLAHQTLRIATASLRGPFDCEWQNPWKSERRLPRAEPSDRYPEFARASAVARGQRREERAAVQATASMLQRPLLHTKTRPPNASSDGSMSAGYARVGLDRAQRREISGQWFQARCREQPTGLSVPPENASGCIGKSKLQPEPLRRPVFAADHPLRAAHRIIHKTYDSQSSDPVPISVTPADVILTADAASSLPTPSDTESDREWRQRASFAPLNGRAGQSAPTEEQQSHASLELNKSCAECKRTETCRWRPRGDATNSLLCETCYRKQLRDRKKAPKEATGDIVFKTITLADNVTRTVALPGAVSHCASVDPLSPTESLSAQARDVQPETLRRDSQDATAPSQGQHGTNSPVAIDDSSAGKAMHATTDESAPPRAADDQLSGSSAVHGQQFPTSHERVLRKIWPKGLMHAERRINKWPVSLHRAPSEVVQRHLSQDEGLAPVDRHDRNFWASPASSPTISRLARQDAAPTAPTTARSRERPACSSTHPGAQHGRHARARFVDFTTPESARQRPLDVPGQTGPASKPPQDGRRRSLGEPRQEVAGPADAGDDQCDASQTQCITPFSAMRLRGRDAVGGEQETPGADMPSTQALLSAVPGWSAERATSKAHVGSAGPVQRHDDARGVECESTTGADADVDMARLYEQAGAMLDTWDLDKRLADGEGSE